MSLGYRDNLCQEVSQPDWVDEVEVVETSQVVVVVEEDTVVMEELGSWGGERGGGGGGGEREEGESEWEERLRGREGGKTNT